MENLIENKTIDKDICDGLISRIGRKKFTFNVTPKDDVLVLISGYLDYVNDQFDRLQTHKAISIVDK